MEKAIAARQVLMHVTLSRPISTWDVMMRMLGQIEVLQLRDDYTIYTACCKGVNKKNLLPNSFIRRSKPFALSTYLQTVDSSRAEPTPQDE
jgi:hypothetical protein